MLQMEQRYIDPLGIFVDVKKTHLPGPLSVAKTYAARNNRRLLTHIEWSRTADFAEKEYQEMFEDMVSGCVEATDSVVVFQDAQVVFDPKLVGGYPVLVEGADIRLTRKGCVIAWGSRESVTVPTRSDYIWTLDARFLPAQLSERPVQDLAEAFYRVIPSGVRVIRRGMPQSLNGMKYSRKYDLDITAPPENLPETAYRFCTIDNDTLSPSGTDWGDFLRRINEWNMVLAGRAR